MKLYMAIKFEARGCPKIGYAKKYPEFYGVQEVNEDTISYLEKYFKALEPLYKLLDNSNLHLKFSEHLTYHFRDMNSNYTNEHDFSKMQGLIHMTKT